MDLKVSMLAYRGSTIGPKHFLKTESRWETIESRRGEAAMMLSKSECIEKKKGGVEAVDKPGGPPHLIAIFFFFRTEEDPATNGGE